MFLAMKYLKEGGLFQKRALGFSVLRKTFLFLVLSFLFTVFLLTGCTNFLWGTPQAAFTHSPELCYCHQQMTFDASGCSGGKDVIATYSWTFSDGTSTSGSRVHHTFANSGDYTVSLTITTEHGQEASVTHTVYVAAGVIVLYGLPYNSRQQQYYRASRNNLCRILTQYPVRSASGLVILQA